jgi:hypothetical protein
MNTTENIEPVQKENNLYDNIKTSTENVPPYYQTILIIILTVFLIFALLGINVFFLIGGLFQSAFDVIKPITFNVASDVGYTTGSVIDQTSNLLTDTGKQTLDIFNGTIQDIGNLLIKSSGKGDSRGNSSLSISLNSTKSPPKEPEPTQSTNPIQTPSSSQWCLVGEYQDRKGCIEVGKEDKCLSGQIFPSQHQCLQSK